MMKYGYLFVIVLAVCFGCGRQKKVPDVSNIKVNLPLQRFEQDFFAIDTNNIDYELSALQSRYGNFLNDYLYNILQLPTEKDSVIAIVKRFLKDYKPVYEAAGNIKNLKEQQNAVVYSLKLVKHYFPEYGLPPSLITFVGPVEGYGNVLTPEGLAVGLQLYLGKNYPLYNENFLRDVYPSYISRRFEPEYIAVNCIKNIVDDIYPQNTSGKPLIENMIEQGKRLYMLDLFMPETPDSLKTGYTAAQLKGAEENEALIWNFFLQNNLLYVSDPSQIRDYINDAPNTAVFGEASPGNIAQFTGWQIIKKYMADHPEATLQQLLSTPANKIFQEAKYKPK